MANTIRIYWLTRPPFTTAPPGTDFEQAIWTSRRTSNGNAGAISFSTLDVGGINYAPLDLFNVVGGTTAATGQVLTVGAGGVVLTYTLLSNGLGYTTANNVATTATTGSGTGFELNIGVNSSAWAARELFYSLYDNPPAGGVVNADIVDGISAGINIPSQVGKLAIVLSLTSFSQNVEQLYDVVGNVTPTEVDPVNTPDGWDYFTVAQGPFFFNGYWWLIGNQTQFGIPPVPAAVFRSADVANKPSGGWTRVDVANEPTTNISAIWGQYDGIDSKLRFVGNTGGGNYQLLEFDMLANGGLGGWGSFHDPVAIGSVNSFGQTFVYSPFDGVSHIFYRQGGANQYQYFNGAWSGAIAVPVTGLAPYNHALLDPDGQTLHVTYAKLFSSLIYQQIQAGGVMGPGSTVGGSSLTIADPGHGAIYTDQFDNITKIVIPLDYNVGNGDIYPAIAIGYPLSNPVWQPIEVVGALPGDKATCTYTIIEGPILASSKKFMPQYTKNAAVGNN